MSNKTPALKSFGRLSIVVSTQAARFEALPFTEDFEASLGKIAGFGYQGVELAIRDPALVEVNKLKNLLENLGLAVPAIGTGQAWAEEHISFTSPDASIRSAAVERIKRQIELAGQLGALVIIGLIRGVSPTSQAHEQSMHYLVENLQVCAAYAEANAIKLALEPLNRYETDLITTVHEGMETLFEVGSPALGLLLDTFHMNIEEANIEASIQEAGEHILHFHVADSNRWYPGAGHLDFRGILVWLRATGYQGWISGEFMPQPDGGTAAERSLAYLSKILAS